jgi:hypothetical protein
MQSMSITVGLRNYRVIADAAVEAIDCDCGRAEITCPPETTLRELDEVISGVAEYEVPVLVQIPLLRAS